MVDLSISIVNWNTKDLLRDCLESVFKSKGALNYEVFVVDNASVDGSTQMVKKRFPQAKLIENRENLGFSKANNQALRKSKGRYFLLLNSDVIVSSNTLKKMVEFMDEHAKAGVAGCRLVDSDGTPQPSYGDFHSLAKVVTGRLIPTNFTEKWLGRYIRPHRDSQEAREVDWVSGAFLVARREAIDEVGMLDENIFMYFEDDDWCYRMKQRGWRVYFVPQAQAVHLFGKSIERVRHRISVQSVASKYYFYRKHYCETKLCMLRIFQTAHSLLVMGLQLVNYLLQPNERNKVKKLLHAHKEIIKLSFER